MRYLILSDIHANQEALEAVLEYARNRYDQILCCGDVVGYGPDPNRVTEWVRSNVPTVVRGNHDKACSGLESFEDYNPAAKISTVWTHQSLTPENLEYLRALPQGPVAVEEFEIAHGSPDGEDDYLLNMSDARQAWRAMRSSVCFIGHTHVQGGFRIRTAGKDPAHSEDAPVQVIQKVPSTHEHGALVVEDGWHYLINAGSVGQPRDRDPRAGFAIYASETRRLDYFRIPYNFALTQAKIQQAELPIMLAVRLGSGT